MPLTEIALKKAKPSDKPIKLADGQGLYVYISPSGSKLWRMDYRFDGKRKTLSFGAWPKVSIATARGLREQAREALQDGVDPAEGPKATPHNSFKAVYMEWITPQPWVGSYKSRVMSRFDEDILPVIGDERIDTIEPPKLLKALREIENRGAVELAKRMRQHVSAVFQYAVATGKATRDPAADLRRAMKPVPKGKSRAFVPPGQMGDFLAKLAEYDGDSSTRLAVLLTIHTMTRTNEIRFGRWDEIDGNIWRIPAERMKMSREHLIPITPAVAAILEGLKNETEWIAPGPTGRPMSENTMLYALYRLGYHSRATMHGFRRLASTVLNESGLWTPDAIERQLAHAPENEIRAIYNAAQYLDERRRMMEWWSNWLVERGASSGVPKVPAPVGR